MMMINADDDDEGEDGEKEGNKRKTRERLGFVNTALGLFINPVNPISPHEINATIVPT